MAGRTLLVMSCLGDSGVGARSAPGDTPRDSAAAGRPPAVGSLFTSAVRAAGLLTSSSLRLSQV